MTNQISAELAAILAVADDGTHTEIDDQGTKIWRNADGQIHRDGDLPAMIYSYGPLVYYKNGLRHREGDLPAFIWFGSSIEYYKNDKLHRDGDHPAVFWSDGLVEYWVDGVWQKNE